jgi:rhomboid protease GluP
VLYLLLPQKNYQITPILILINIALYFLKIIASIVYFSYVFKHKLAINEIENLYYYLGGNSREVVLNGQYWRLLTYQFIHGSFSHLFFNMYALVYIGLMIEHKLGTKKYLTIYFLSGISGGVLSMFFHTEGYMVGASGAIIGMFGAFLALLLGKAFEKNATKALLISTIAVTFIMLLNGLKGGVDNAAHVGGLLAGFLITTILFHQKPLNIKLQEKQRYLIAVLLAIFFAIPSLLLMPKYQIKEFNRLEIEYQLNARKFTTIYWLKRGLSKEEKLSAIKNNGINVWKANDSIVKKMDLLKVDKRQQNIISFHQKMVKRHLELVGLFYKRTTTDGQTYFYDTEIQSLQMDINNIRLNIKNPTRF